MFGGAKRTVPVCGYRLFSCMADDGQRVEIFCDAGHRVILPEEPCGCGGMVPGVLWPWGTNGDEDHDWIERCDECKAFESDEDAAEALAKLLGVTVKWAVPSGLESEHPYIDMDDETTAEWLATRRRRE